MVAFFVVVGLEIRREYRGRGAPLVAARSGPVAAALGGMAVPAVIYALVLHGGAGSRGWGIPMATDVAFSLACLPWFDPRRRGCACFLLTLAVADDIASIVILVCFYSHDVRLWSLLAAVAAVAAMAAVQRARACSTAWLIALGAISWWALVHAGVEASVIGVAIGLLVPPGEERSVVGASTRAVVERARAAGVRTGERRCHAHGIERLLG